MTNKTKRKIGEKNKVNMKRIWKDPDYRKKMLDGRVGRKLSEEHKKNIGKSLLGHTYSEETRRKMSLTAIKNLKNNILWKGGITPEERKLRMSIEYKLWREAVFKRDNYTCVWCGSKNKKGIRIILNADHIKPFALYPELRFALDNGRTLCVPCHRTTDTFGLKPRQPKI